MTKRSQSNHWPISIGLSFVGLLASPLSFAADYTVNPGDDFYAICANLNAGDHVLVNGGTYHSPGYRVLTFAGSESQPIVVEAAPGTTPHIIGDYRPLQNTLNLDGQYFTFRGFEISDGSHGIRFVDVHHAILEDLHIHHTVDVALSANYAGKEYYNNIFRRLHLHDTGGTGEGMYLGCNEGACTFHDNLIEYNWIHDTNHDVSQGDGIEIKQGSYGNIVRNNVIHDTQYPCIIVYGTAGNARNIVENNVMWNCQDSGIQVAADAIVHNNLIFNAGNGINSHTHQTAVPSNLDIIHNSVFNATDRCLRGSDWADSTGIVIANNAFYCEGGNAIRIATGGTDITFTNNIILGAVEGISTGYSSGRSTAQDFVDVANHDAWPSADSPVIAAATPSFAVPFDYNWNTRDSDADVGAYEWQLGGNPGWHIDSMFRPIVETPAVDAGMNTDAYTGQDLVVGIDNAPASDAGHTDTGATDTDSADARSRDNEAASRSDANNKDEPIAVACQCRHALKPSGFGMASVFLLSLALRRRWLK